MASQSLAWSELYEGVESDPWISAIEVHQARRRVDGGPGVLEREFPQLPPYGFPSLHLHPRNCLGWLLGVVQLPEELAQDRPLDQPCPTYGEVGEGGHQLLGGPGLQLEEPLEFFAVVMGADGVVNGAYDRYGTVEPRQ